MLTYTRWSNFVERMAPAGVWTSVPWFEVFRHLIHLEGKKIKPRECVFPRLFRSPNNLGGYYTVSIANSLIEQISMLIIMTESAEFSLTDKNHMPFVPLRMEAEEFRPWHTKLETETTERSKSLEYVDGSSLQCSLAQWSVAQSGNTDDIHGYALGTKAAEHMSWHVKVWENVKCILARSFWSENPLPRCR